MIRRRVGDEFWLITQDDHARLSGQLARYFGNERFAAPEPSEHSLHAIAQHDAGWTAHDAAPTLTDAGLPADFLEMPRPLSHSAWLQSARLASGIDPYVGLLVTLHQFHLSAATVVPAPAGHFDVGQLREQFAVNKFQHAMIEHLESLRSQLGMATDRPLRLGLADGWTNRAEDWLRFNFRVLQALDALSLAACCTRPPKLRIGPFHETPGGAEISLAVARPAAARVIVTPWPFNTGTIRVDVAYRAVPARMYADAADLQSAYASARPQQQRIEFAAQ